MLDSLQMRRLAVFLLILYAATGFAASTLGRDIARKRISELSSSQLVLDAIEIRGIHPENPDAAVVDSTITLAFQFSKTNNENWAVDAIRLGDRDWVDMKELLAAIYHGKPPSIAPQPKLPPLTPVTPMDTFHVNKSDFELERERMIELGLSPLVPGAIETRRIIFASDVRTIAEATVTMGFRFKRNSKSGSWTIESARLGDREWIDIPDLLATLNDGRRRETLAKMRELAAGIEKYRAVNGSLPVARDIVKLTDMLQPDYMTDLIRVDGWGREFQYAVSGSTFRLRSRGPDGRFNTPDDLVVTSSASSSP